MIPVMLFAAGFGTRMGDLTKNKPKPLIEVAGKPLIDHALSMAEQIQPSRIVANLHYLPDLLAEHLTGCAVTLSHEAPEILDTGGGLKAAMPLLESETVITMNTDAIWAGANPLRMLLEHWTPSKMDALLMCVPVEQAVGHTGTGDFDTGADGRITRGSDLIYGGVQILKTEGLNAIEDRVFSLNRLWDRMQRNDRLFGTIYPDRWCDVGHPQGIPLAEALLADV
ncbi:MAG: nucleotidyltransferase family protein [Pseudomonadota bacterium]